MTFVLISLYVITRAIKLVRVFLFGGRVVRGSRDRPDGDTIKIRRWFFKTYSVRLNEIDAPEKDQDWGREATSAIFKLAPVGSLVTLSDAEADRHGRLAATVWNNGLALNPFAVQISCNEQMVADGHAWHYADYSQSKFLSNLQKKARNKKRGLWSKRNPTEPKIWRRRK